MNLIATLAKKWNYSVENPEPGRLLYCEGNREYTFPFYEEDGVWVLVAVPSAQRIHFFFTWQAMRPEFSRETRDRVIPRIQERLRARGMTVRLFEPGEGAGREFEFHAELCECRNRAVEWLAAEDLNQFADYSSIDPLSAEHGLEISGIQSQRRADLMARILQRGFPHWHHQNISAHNPDGEPGWTVALCLFPARTGDPEWLEGD